MAIRLHTDQNTVKFPRLSMYHLMLIAQIKESFQKKKKSLEKANRRFSRVPGERRKPLGGRYVDFHRGLVANVLLEC